MKILKISAPLILAATLLTACAGNPFQAAGPARASEGVLTGANGMTLYTFDKDPEGSGKSVCNGPCATNWPPLLVTTDESAAPGYSVVMRDDGAKQWAYKGKPLYFWIKDQKPGDRTGDGFNGVWRVAKP
jgi:predicted lipoprotein with Yx(FWY)xxD motif